MHMYVYLSFICTYVHTCTPGLSLGVEGFAPGFWGLGSSLNIYGVACDGSQVFFS